MTPQTRRMRWWRDPLLHFLLLGTGVFALHYWLAPPTSGTQIILSEPVVRGLQQEYVRRTGSEPSPRDADAIIEQYVRNEVLYREALAQGLDRGDIIVRRRLVQKMQFLLENLDPVPEPTEVELRAYLDAHAERYAVAERVSLTHVFVRTDGRGANATAVASDLRERLRRGEDPSTLGDPFLHGATFALRPTNELARLFGDEFVKQLAQCTPGVWSAPIRSSFGLHLVRVTERQAGRLPPLAEVRSTVQRDWTEERRATLNERALERLRRRYEVRVEAPMASKVAALR
jgi:peptidyl-prolyl cis-trans isomerase C